MNPGLKASDIYKGAQALLNDLGAQNFTNTALQPFLVIAMQELSEVFEDNGLPITDKLSTEIKVAIGITDIGGPTGLALPQDLIEITACYERPWGSAQDFIKMDRRDYLPETVTQTTYLIFWAWQQQIIRFIGATSDIGVKLEYVANVFPTINDDNTIIPIINAKNALVFRLGGLAAEFIGENTDRATSLNGQGSAALDRLINLSIRGQQSINTRRRPFRAGWKTRNSG